MTATTGEIPLLNGKASVYPRLLLFKKSRSSPFECDQRASTSIRSRWVSIAPNALTMATLVENTAGAHGVARRPSNNHDAPLLRATDAHRAARLNAIDCTAKCSWPAQAWLRALNHKPKY
jgi:hypothetical protein